MILRLIVFLAILTPFSNVAAQETVELFVWDDTNGNGIQEGEPGIDGIAASLELFENGTSLGAPTDMGGGIYQWTITAMAVDYYIEYNGSQAPVWYPLPNITADPDAGDATDDTDLGGGMQSQIFNITPGSNATIDNIDFALVAPSTISDFVWNDLNGDGLQDGGEPGYDWMANGIAITITYDDLSPVTDLLGNSPPVANDLGGGNYSFTELPPGNYILNFSQVAGTAYRTMSMAGAGTIDSDPDMNTGDTPTITLTSGLLLDDIDAGYVLPASIGDMVWEDLNGNGIQDAGEAGLDGVTVSLTDDTGAAVNDLDGNAVTPELTAGGGLYMFDLLPPGDYIVEFGDFSASNYYRTLQHQTGTADDAGDTADDSDADQTTGQTHIITLTSEEMQEDIDAGYFEPATVEIVVWHDGDGNGLYDGGVNDSPLPNMTVRLVDALGAGGQLDVFGAPLADVVTDAAGMATISNIPPGNYRVEFDGLPTFESTYSNISGAVLDAADVADDSDVPEFVTTALNSHEFELTSGEVENRIGAGYFMRMSIGNQIWVDDDGDNIYDAAIDGGASGVAIDLFYDSDFDGNPDLGAPIATVASAGDGSYSFDNLIPGYYIVSVNENNFGNGGALSLFQTCTPFEDPNNGTDNDDNGDGDALGGQPVQTMVIQLFCIPDEPVNNPTIDLCFFFDCENPDLSSAFPTCEQASANVICNLIELDSYCGTMYSEESPGNQPVPLCPGQPQTGAHNITWFAFVAGGQGFSLEVIPTNCSGSTGNNEGIQAGVYTDCNFTDAVFCNGNCETTPFTISTGLVPGETYYLFLDGCNNSVCDFEINVVDGGSVFEIPEPTGLNCDVPNCGPVCPGSEVVFTVEGLDIDIEYNWTIPANSVLVGDGDQTGNDVVTQTNTLTLQFTDEGTYDVTMNFAANGCDMTAVPATATVVIENLPDEEFGEFMVCEHDFPYTVDLSLDPNGDGVGWTGGEIAGPGEDITVSYTNPEGCTFNQIIDIIQIDNQAPEPITFYSCTSDLPIEYDGGALVINDGTYNEGQDYTLINTQTVAGCDSIVNITTVLYELFVDLQQTDCENGQVTINTVITDQTPAGLDLSYIWVGTSGGVVTDGDNDDSSLVVSESGNYSVIVLMSDNNVSCDFESGSITVDIESQLPEAPEPIDWNLSPCINGQTITYAIEEEGSASYQWYISGDGSILGSENGATVEVQWGPAGGQLCAELIFDCGPGPQLCNAVTPSTASEISVNVVDEACEDTDVTILFTGSVSSTATFNWDFGNGVNANTAGPHTVNYDTPGLYYITVSADDNGCMTNTAIDSILIYEKLAAPVITCSSSTDGVVFSWMSNPGATGYQVDLVSGTAGTQVDDTTYVVTGLAEGDGVTIEVTPLTNDPCMEGLSAQLACFAQNCDEPTITFDVAQDSICLIPTAGTQTITANINPPGGLGVFAGPGITDAANGVFDANVAGVGLHNISYTWTGDDGCVFSYTVPMVVLEQPEVAFSLSSDTICISDAVTVAYGGSTAGVTTNWNFGPNVVNVEDGTGPFEIRFSSPGVQTITLQVSKDICESEMISKEVLVQDTLAPLVISCENDETSITFMWNDIADTYQVTLDGVDQGTTTDNMWPLTGLAPGTSAEIEVTAMSGNKCPSVSDELTCQASNCPPVEVNIDQSDQQICLDGSDQSIALSYTVMGGLNDGTGVATWSGAGVNTMTGVFDPVAAGVGSHAISLDFVEGTCAATPAIITITVVQTPAASFSGVMTICEGGQLVLTYDGPSLAGATYNWTTTGADVVGADDQMSITLNYPSAGTFDVSLIVEDSGCSSMPSTQSVTVDNNLLPPAIICANPSSEAINFEWGAVAGASGYEVIIDGTSQGVQTNTSWSDTNVSPGDSIMIEVIAISSNSCPNSSSIRTCYAIDCPATEIMTSVGDTSICSNTLIDFDIDFEVTGGFGTGAGTGVFTGDGVDPATGNVTASDLQLGTNIIYIDFSENGCDTRDSIIVTVIDLPTLSNSVSSNEICVTDSVVVTYTGDSVSDGSLSYNVTGDPTVVSNLPGINEYKWSSPGDYTITPVYTQGECEVVGEVINITVQPELIAPVIDCTPNNNDINVTWSAVDCASQYNVIVDGTLASTQSELSYAVTGLDDGQSVEIEIVAVSDCLCDNVSTTITCSATPCPEFTTVLNTPISDCISSLGETVNLNASTTGGAGNGTITWSGDNVSSDGVWNVAASGVGVHTVSYSYAEGSCTQDTMFTLEVFGQPEVMLSTEAAPCFSSLQGMLSFTASGNANIVSYTISGNDDQLPTTVDQAGSLALAAGQTYTVLVTDANGCTAEATATIDIPAEPTYSLSGPAIIPLGENGVFTIDLGTLDASIVTNIRWYDSEGNVLCEGEDCNSINVEPSKNTTYCTDITIEGNCVITECIEVVSEFIPNINISNVFSPNDDGVNDKMVIQSNNPEMIANYLRIYDRWGNMVFNIESPWKPYEDMSYPGWDGTFKGQKLNPGVFVYVMEYIEGEGQPVQLRYGDITLIR